MDKNNVDKMNEAVEKLTEAAQSPYEMAVENTLAVQESDVRLARSLFESSIEALKVQAEIQTETNRRTLESLAEQVRKNQGAFLELSRGSLNAYEGFLDSLSSYRDQVLKEAEEPGN